MHDTEKIPSANQSLKSTDKKQILSKLKPSTKSQKNNYNPQIPRKLAEALCDVSTNTLVRLEQNNIIVPKSAKHKSMKIITYDVNDILNIFKYKDISFKQKEEAEVISIFSQKGGVGKSAFTQHLGSMLSLVGKVLIIDLDAQSDATILYGQDPNYGELLAEDAELDPTIAELMDWSEEGDDGPSSDIMNFKDVVKNISPNLDIIPSDLDLGEINYSLNRLKLRGRYFNEEGEQISSSLFMVKEVVDKVKNNYDFILFDCPPNIETCNVSALFASNRILIPLELEAKCLTTMRRNSLFLERLTEIHSGFEWDKILIVPNKFRREKIKTKALAALEDRYTDNDFISLSQVVVPNSSIIDKCSDWKKPIFTATHRFGGTPSSAIHQAKDFTNYFWAIMHEILDIEIDRLIFDEGGD